MPVDHIRAIDEQLADRYVLREMPAAEAEEFEHHFFECAECASAVEMGQVLLANGRQIMRRPEGPAADRMPEIRRLSTWGSLMRWWKAPAVMIPSAAALLLAMLAVYQSAVLIPGLRAARDAARVLPAFQLIGASRGEAVHVAVPRNAGSFLLTADIPPDAQFAHFACELSSGGGLLFRLIAQVPPAGQPVTILVPARNLKAGAFELTILGLGEDGRKQEKVVSFPFDLRFLP
jgi:hypothetical protein